MRFLPHTDEDVASMLRAVGLTDIDSLFSTIPVDCRRTTDLNLPEALSEWQLNNRMNILASSVATFPEYRVFAGAGSYEHYIPESVSYLLGRSEFVTSYTPYQPEMSQGTLQAIYEYQTLAARLLGMEVANASLYDGATALAEALLMALRITKKKRVALSSLIHPFYQQVVRTYLGPTGVSIDEIPYDKDGRTDYASLKGMEDCAALAIQSPNFLGSIEKLREAADLAHDNNSLLITAFTEPLAYALIKNPGSEGADIACGEGQSLGIPRSFGGPGLGMFAASMKHVRSMPGRLVGKTLDEEGRLGFVLTLATREQHIRREKATSNICTNNSLCALASAMYMASLGGTGIKELARLNYDKSEYLKGQLKRAGFSIPFKSATFNEFVVEFPDGFESTYKQLLKQKIVAGLPLAPWYPELYNHYLLCVTETASKEDLDTLVREVKS
ncbi:MAG: aminomethyl-transferring glycine dehydrogenase subunit GcvPA [Deltaproteobacteria bacterium]|nr:aminomethyl-transferring glycine dehydrogenase subunit GcvPA [Deltaproteobacteria bacterium]MBN2688682.1 aminomethyl-transferring glycine dehydrogenase subunit GcvPA [Deltaproteobacteria bacterium]